MGEEEGFLNAIADDGSDLVPQLVYADWLEERGDEGAAACLRAWIELIAFPYGDATFRLLQSRLEQYQSQIQAADPEWVRRMAKARDWVDADLAEKVARLYLRTRQGRKTDRQWLQRIFPPSFDGKDWGVAYWRNSPDPTKVRSWQGNSINLTVDRVTAWVLESRYR